MYNLIQINYFYMYKSNYVFGKTVEIKVSVKSCEYSTLKKLKQTL